jgi:hypothetical protein
MHNRALLVGMTLVWLAVLLGMAWPERHSSAAEPPTPRGTAPEIAPDTDQSAADKAAVAALQRAKRRCLSRCDQENGECNSEARQSRQVCSKEVSNGGNDPFSGRPEAFDYYCGYFDIAQCGNRDCAARFAQRYAECVQFMRGSITSRRFDCMRAQDKAQALCRVELRDCRADCDE